MPPLNQGSFHGSLVEKKLAGTDTHVGDKQMQGGMGHEEKDNIRASILEAVIVFSTPSHSRTPIFSRLRRGFDVVIVDEAAQAVEPATLVLLANGCKQVFLTRSKLWIALVGAYDLVDDGDGIGNGFSVPYLEMMVKTSVRIDLPRNYPEFKYPDGAVVTRRDSGRY
ncbi:hypothetical protein OROGR_030753 [Orobanche gracilis]